TPVAVPPSPTRRSSDLSRKKPSRGVVATQLGLPRPALRNADCVVRDVFLASLISSSLISNGLRASNLRSVRMSVMPLSSRTNDRSEEHTSELQSLTNLV